MTSPRLEALNRWSCVNNELPDVDEVKHLHVYDFDNTLFASPLPNRQLWSPSDIGRLQTQHVFTDGGWWHDPGVLSATGEGLEKEEPRAWEGWWNEQIINLIELSMQQTDALSVLLTGRSNTRFAHLIQRMVNTRKLSFDIICLKPEIGPQNQNCSTTNHFKQSFLESLVRTYSKAEEIRVYEDRPKHVQAFRDFFTSLNQNLASGLPDSHQPPGDVRSSPINFEVIEIADLATTLDPVYETAQIQRMINRHNTAVREGKAANSSNKLYSLKRNVIFTGYLISPNDTYRLLDVAGLPHTPTKDTKTGDVIRLQANTVMIRLGVAPPFILNQVGGLGASLRWRATGVGEYSDSVWALRVEPIPPNAKFCTLDSTPFVVLALRGKSARQADAKKIKMWIPLPLDKCIEFDTVVGEKATLQIDEQRAPTTNGAANTNQANAAQRPPKRPMEDDFPALPKPGSDRSAPPGATTSAPNGVPQQQNRYYRTNENRRPDGVPTGPSAVSAVAARGRGAPNHDSRNNRGNRSGQQQSRGGGSGGGGGGGRGKGRGVYRSLDDTVPPGSKNNPLGLDGAMEVDGDLDY